MMSYFFFAWLISSILFIIFSVLLSLFTKRYYNPVLEMAFYICMAVSGGAVLLSGLALLLLVIEFVLKFLI